MNKYGISEESINDLLSKIDVCDIGLLEPESVKRGYKTLVSAFDKFEEARIVYSKSETPEVIREFEEFVKGDPPDMTIRIYHLFRDYNLDEDHPIVVVTNNSDKPRYLATEGFRGFLIDESGIDC